MKIIYFPTATETLLLFLSGKPFQAKRPFSLTGDKALYKNKL